MNKRIINIANIILLVTAFFFLAGHLALYFIKQNSGAYFRPYAMVLDGISPLDQRICKANKNCLDLIELKELCTRTDLGLQ